MGSWNIATACSVELGDFARANGVVFEVDPGAVGSILETMTEGQIYDEPILLCANLVRGNSRGNVLTNPEEVPDGYKVNVAVAGPVDLGRTMVSKPRYPLRENDEIDQTTVHELQHVADLLHDPMIVAERREAIDVHLDRKDLNFDHSMRLAMPIAGERTLQFIDAMRLSGSTTYRALLLGMLFMRLVVMAKQDEAETSHFYWNENPMEIRARVAEEYVDTFIPDDESAVFRTSTLPV